MCGVESIARRSLLGGALGLLLATAACVSPERAWADARERGTQAAYASFLREHPTSEHAPDARRAIDELQWDQAQEEGTVGAYEAFLDRRGDGPRADDARAAIEALDWQVASERDTVPALRSFLRAHPDGARAADARAAIEALDWTSATVSGERDDLVRFLDEHPDGARRAEAERAIEDLDWRPFEERPTVNAWRTFARLHPSSMRLADRAGLESAILEHALAQRSRGSLGEFLEAFPGSDRADEARAALDAFAWERAAEEDEVWVYETYLEEHSTGTHVDEAHERIEALRWAEAERSGTAPALAQHLSRYPDTPHADTIRSFLAEDAELWRATLIERGQTAMEMKNWASGTGVSLGYGSAVVAQYLLRREEVPDVGLHVVTTLWPDEALDPATRAEHWNDDVLVLLDAPDVIYAEPCAFVVEISRLERDGAFGLDFACAELALADGTTRRPCALLLSHVPAEVTGTLVGCLFKGELRLDERTWRANQEGPPYAGSVKLSIPDEPVLPELRLPRDGRLQVGLLFQANVDEAVGLTVLGREVPLE